MLWREVTFSTDNFHLHTASLIEVLFFLLFLFITAVQFS
jgi:hypothetical protein